MKKYSPAFDRLDNVHHVTSSFLSISYYHSRRIQPVRLSHLHCNNIFFVSEICREKINHLYLLNNDMIRFGQLAADWRGNISAMVMMREEFSSSAIKLSTTQNRRIFHRVYRYFNSFLKFVYFYFYLVITNRIIFGYRTDAYKTL